MKRQKLAAFAAVIILTFSVYFPVRADAAKVTEVIPGGMPFGVRFDTGKLSVSGFCDVDTEKGAVCPSKLAGICENDVIVMVNGRKVKEAEGVTEAVKNSNGETMIFTVERNGKTEDLKVTPEKSESSGDYRIGIWLRDGSAGIGTVTYIIPETGAFGGLGHGICDTVSGELITLTRGAVSHVKITDVAKGVSGDPGELRGIFSPDKCGSIIKNTPHGVFGVMTDAVEKKTVKVGEKIRSGDASLLCTVSDAGCKEYGIRISENENAADGTFYIEVTDGELISATGGIVQGMSGSPVLQDGKLIGAVTHVLINDPLRGYGITAEKMLKAMPDELK